MENDLIRRKDVIEEIAKSARENFSVDDGFQTWLDALKNADERIRKLPAVDAVEVRHGRWLPHPNKEYPDTEVCSSCGMGTITGKFIFQFCPWRGASMDGEEEHNAAD